MQRFSDYDYDYDYDNDSHNDNDNHNDIDIDIMSQPLDAIDRIATNAFEGYVVRKDLVRKFKGQYPVPTYVAEFLLGR